MHGLHTLACVLTLLAACGQGPSGAQQNALPIAQPSAAVATQVALDAAVPPDAPPPPKLACETGTAVTPAPAPDPTWACARPDGTREGPFIVLFPDDTIEISGTYKDGVLDGAWLRKHPNGAVAETGAYAAGQKTGTWKQANASGVALGEYTLSAGTGTEKHWYEDGTLYSEQAVKSGVAQGVAKVYAQDGTVLVVAKYDKGKLDGPHNFGTRQSMRFEETFDNGVRQGKRTIWQFGVVIAEESYNRAGKLDGDYTLHRSAKVIRVKGEFKAGRRTGAWQWWDRDNNKEREGSYTAGKRDGLWQEWTENKLTWSGNYTDGKPDGEFAFFTRGGAELGRFTITGGTGTMLTFWGNRKVSSKQRMYQGAADGVYQELNIRDKVLVEGHYRADVRHGAWKEWTPDGKLPTLEEGWKRGKLDGKVKKLIDGKVSMEATYTDGKATGPYQELRAGKPSVTGQFADDLKDGAWTFYAADGTVVRTATYKAGVLDGPYHELVDGVVVEGAMAGGRRSGTWTVTDKAGAVRKLAYTTP